jgi:hypothetical protein
MNILRGERGQAKDIIDDLQKKLQVVVAVLNDYDLERQVCSVAWFLSLCKQRVVALNPAFVSSEPWAAQCSMATT